MTTKKNFEIGQQWKCRDGSRAVILARSAKQPLFSLRVWFERLDSTRWVDEAGNHPNRGMKSLDLIEPWREPRTGELWVNVYDNGETAYGGKPIAYGHKTKKEADLNAGEDRIACVHIPKWTEGEGLGDD